MTEASRTIETIWREEASKVISRVARIVRDVGLAEEFAQDALVAALENWPLKGTPDAPGAWLMTTAKRRALDYLRHVQMAADKAVEVGSEVDFAYAVATENHDRQVDEAIDASGEAAIEDDLLRLMFTACHPVLAPEARCALTLRVMGGLGTDEIARAYLKPEATIAQRIVRAKRTLAAARIPFEIPNATERAPRLASVLEVIYLIFNEGYSATSGENWIRPALCSEALRLGRLLAELMPDEAEVLGLLALMAIQASRLATRVTADGEPVLLLDQNRLRWDRQLIREGLDALTRLDLLPAPRGPYALQATIAACHASAADAAHTDWARIVDGYDQLHSIAPSPVVALNRAVAVAMAYGPAAGLQIVDSLQDESSLQNYHLLPSVRGDLLVRLERLSEARAEFERAAQLTRNARERALLLARASRCMET